MCAPDVNTRILAVDAVGGKKRSAVAFRLSCIGGESLFDSATMQAKETGRFARRKSQRDRSIRCAISIVASDQRLIILPIRHATSAQADDSAMRYLEDGALADEQPTARGLSNGFAARDLLRGLTGGVAFRFGC